MVNSASVFRDITNQSIHGDFIRNRLYNSTKGEPIHKIYSMLRRPDKVPSEFSYIVLEDEVSHLR